MVSYENRSLPDLMMGVETPIPPFAMDAATVQDFLTKIFSNRSSLMRRPIPRRGAPAADQSPKKENGNLPRRAVPRP
jgi:hypothetical protein